MNDSRARHRKVFRAVCGSALLVLFGMGGCTRTDSDRVQGYVEGEFVHVASPLAGALVSLAVERGAKVVEGDPLFALDNAPEQALRDEAQRRLVQARANLEDARKGKRPPEIESLEAQLRQARAALAYSEKEFVRQGRLVHSGGGALRDHERALSTRDQDLHRVAQLEADLRTARLGSRIDQVAAAEAEVLAREATLAKTEWDLSQKSQAAPRSGLVFDTLYREGEWVGAGLPVVVLLPPANIKVRAFVPEIRIGSIHPGDRVRVTVDGVAEPFEGKVSFVSPRAEYTPPVIYSKESRDKLVFMIEAVFDPETAQKLHPGQPVDVWPGS